MLHERSMSCRRPPPVFQNRRSKKIQEQAIAGVRIPLPRLGGGQEEAGFLTVTATIPRTELPQ